MTVPAGALADALHVTNGDATDLAGTGLMPPERVLAWRDVLHEGPVPALPPTELRRVRAEFLVGAGVDDRGEATDMFAARDRTLEDNRVGHYVLWFEADLYCQLQVVQVLDRLAGLGVPPDRIDLICLGEYPGIARFGGLGELTAAQLARLPHTDVHRTLTPAALATATRAWTAFTAPTPEGLLELQRVRDPELRFVGEAFERLVREYPSTRDGLSLTERRLLAAVADGATDPMAAFLEASGKEPRPFLGDTWAFAILHRLAGGAVPLVTDDLALTAAARDVLAGWTDHVELNGVDRWVGGVQLTDHEDWRYDEGLERVVPA